MSRDCGEGGPDGCMCRGGGLNLDILKDVQRAYEERLNAVERYGGPRKLQMQVDVMKSWVDDLAGQNALLVQAIEELETEATAKLLHERTKHSEIEGELSAELSALRRRLARKDSDLRGLIEVLRRLREFDYCTLEGIHFFEVTESDIFGSVEWRNGKLEQGDMKSGVKMKPPSTKSKNRTRYKLDKKGKQCKELKNIADLSSACSKRDVAVSAGICCSDRVESAEQNVCALRKVNVALSEELHALRRVCAALDKQCSASTLHAQFKDEIIREMRRQLKVAKAKVSCQALASSTPARSAGSTRSEPDLSLIERDPSVQNISGDSVEDLEKRIFRDCCLTPSSMVASAQQARIASASSGFIPTIGLATTRTSRHCSRHTSTDCDCESSDSASNKEHRKSGSGSFKKKKRSEDQNTALQNENAKECRSSDRVRSESSDKNSKKKRKKGRKKKSKSGLDSDSNSDDAFEPCDVGTGCSVVTPCDATAGTCTMSSLEGSSDKNSKKKNRKKGRKKKSKSGSDSDSNSDDGFEPCEVGTGCAVVTPCDAAAGTCTMSSLEMLLCDMELPIPSCSASPCDSPRPKSYPCTPKELNLPCYSKPCRSKTLPPCLKPCCNPPPASCPDTSKPRPCSARAPCGSSLLSCEDSSLARTLCEKLSSLLPAISPSPCAPQPCPPKSLLKPCSRSQGGSPSRSPRFSEECSKKSYPCGGKRTSFIPCPGCTSSPGSPKPCPAKSLLKPCVRSQNCSPCGSHMLSTDSCRNPSKSCGLFGPFPCPAMAPYVPKLCPAKSSTPKPCPAKRSSDSKPCSRKSCTSSPCDKKSCPAKILMSPPCSPDPSCPKGAGSPKPCPSASSPCDKKLCPASSPPCTPKPCSDKSPCERRFCPSKFFSSTPKPCAEKSACTSRSSSPCEPKPCPSTSSPCEPKPCPGKSSSRSRHSSPSRSPCPSEDSCLNKTFPGASLSPCTPKPCPSLSPCTKSPALPSCIAKPGGKSPKPCDSKPCAPKPCRSKPSNLISPCGSPPGSAGSSCMDISSLSKAPCESAPAPCDTAFNPFDFLKRCVQFLPGSEEKQSCGVEACPTIREEQTDCGDPRVDKCLLTQEESCETAGMCDAARAQFYRNKLISTQQILENKEETVRIQGESLAVAESRLTTLTIRAGQLRQELECKSRELRMLRRAMSACCCKDTPRCDASTEVEAPCADLQKHKNMVKTLETNLSIIEELYRECFFETAKQEALIEKLRQSYLDVRLSDKEKSEEIGRLQNVVNSQKSSLDQCQDIAMEVEGLRMEISNFLNSSNNDSGMWTEDSSATEVGEELQQITDQLLQLRRLLQQEDPCISALTDENNRLKCMNDNLEMQINDYRQKVCDLECTVRNHEDTIAALEERTQCCEKQLRCSQQQVEELTERLRQQECQLRCAQENFNELQCLQGATSQRLEAALEQLSCSEMTEAQLREDLEEAKQLADENQRICGELCALQQTVRAWGAQLQDSQERVCALEAELRRARACADTAARNYRQQLEMTEELQRQLEQAHCRGEALCEESRRIVCAVRQWVRDNCTKRREQEEKICRQQNIICQLNNQLEEARCCCDLPPRRPAPAPSRSGPSCEPRTPCAQDTGCRTIGCTKCGRARERTCGIRTCPSIAMHAQSETKVCEVASCSSGAPRKPLRKKAKCSGERHASRCRSASAQHPEGTCDAAAGPANSLPQCCTTHNVRHLQLAGCIGSVSPPRARSESQSQELLQRVENLHDALVSSQRRWARAPDDR